MNEHAQDGKPMYEEKKIAFREDDFASVATALYPDYPHEWVALEVRKYGKSASRRTGRVIAHDPLCQGVLTKVEALYRHDSSDGDIGVRYFSTDLAESLAR